MKTKLAAAVFALCLTTTAMAAYTITFAEVGGNVVATGTGSINTTALASAGSVTMSSMTDGAFSIAAVGNTTPTQMWEAVSGPLSFGTGTLSFADQFSGDTVGILGSTNRVAVPNSYLSGTMLNSSATWTGATFASLGLDLGTYEWTWGSGPTADKFTVQIGPLPAPVATTSIPTLSEWGLIGLSSILAMFGLARMRRRQR